MGKEDGVVQRPRRSRGVSFDVPENTTVALVGESGSGKSVTAMSILSLLPDNAERSGRDHVRGPRPARPPLDELQRLRGKEIACVFQEPMSSLNPVFTVGQQIAEPLMKHLGMSGARRWSAPRRCSTKSACPSRSGASTPIRTSSPAASSSA